MDETPDENVPDIIETDMPEISGLSIGYPVGIYKIDPVTGKNLGQDNLLDGKLSSPAPFNSSVNDQAVVCKGKRVYVLSPGLEEVQRRNPDEACWPAHTSILIRIDKMGDGSYWLHTESGSVYRLELKGVRPSIDTDAERRRLDSSLCQTDPPGAGDTVV